MPIYAYQCFACRRIEERLEDLDAPPIIQCPACGGTMTRIIVPCAFKLEGEGWAKDRYEKKSKPKKEDK